MASHADRATGQIARTAHFLAVACNGDAFKLDVFELRAVDLAISDDMPRCLDALRWGLADLQTLVSNGNRRMRTVVASWSSRWPADA